MDKDRHKEFAELLAKVFDDAREGMQEDLRKLGRAEDYELFKETFVFHMTDWVDDLERLSVMLRAPDLWTTKKATRFLIGFFYHAVAHVEAAGHLLLDELPEPFKNDEVMTKLAKFAESDTAVH